MSPIDSNSGLDIKIISWPLSFTSEIPISLEWGQHFSCHVRVICIYIYIDASKCSMQGDRSSHPPTGSWMASCSNKVSNLAKTDSDFWWSATTDNLYQSQKIHGTCSNIFCHNKIKHSCREIHQRSHELYGNNNTSSIISASIGIWERSYDQMRLNRGTSPIVYTLLQLNGTSRSFMHIFNVEVPFQYNWLAGFWLKVSLHRFLATQSMR